MIDYTQVREKIETFLETNIDVPIVFENTQIKEENIEHLEVFDTDIDKESMEMGNTVFSVHTLLTVSIFTKVGTGTERAREIATIVDSLLTEQGIPGFEFLTGELYSVGNVEGDFLYQHNYVIQYQYFYGQDDSNSC